MARKVRNTKALPPKIKDTLKEYEFDPDVFCMDSEKGRTAKKIVSELSDVDRIVFLLYTELQSYTEVARVLGVSRSTTWWEVKRIKELIKKRYNEIQSLHSYLP